MPPIRSISAGPTAGGCGMSTATPISTSTAPSAPFCSGTTIRSSVDAIETCLHDRGITYSAAHPLEAELAERVVELVPSAEMAVFSCTGSEATYHAIRLARSATGREKILKFEGHYHGWHDYVAWSVHLDAERDGGDPDCATVDTGERGDTAGAATTRSSWRSTTSRRRSSGSSRSTPISSPR